MYSSNIEPNDGIPNRILLHLLLERAFLLLAMVVLNHIISKTENFKLDHTTTHSSEYESLQERYCKGSSGIVADL
jgi:hypothetical protein